MSKYIIDAIPKKVQKEIIERSLFFKNKKKHYYRYENENSGIRYFKVTLDNLEVLQVVENSGIYKRGRPNRVGVHYITFASFMSSWGWKLRESKYIKQISKAKFDKVLEKMVYKLKK